jgi:ribosomal-protein-alanine N-acetyltransferase
MLAAEPEYLSGKDVCLQPVGKQQATDLAELLCRDHCLRRDLGIKNDVQPGWRDVLAKLDDWCSRNNSVSVAMVCPPYGKAVGLISLSHISEAEQSARIGYWIGSAFRGRGWTSEAFRLILETAKANGIRSVSATVDKKNAPSLNIWRRYSAREDETPEGKIRCTLKTGVTQLPTLRFVALARNTPSNATILP